MEWKERTTISFFSIQYVFNLSNYSILTTIAYKVKAVTH